MSDQERLIEAANAFLGASNEEEMATVFQEYPELLEEEINVIFESAIENARENDELEAAEFFEQHYQELQMIRPQLKELFEQQLNSDSDRLIEAANAFLKISSGEEFNAVFQEYPELLEDDINIIATNALIQILNEEELKKIFQEYPELLEKETNILFEGFIKNARENDELKKAKFFEKCYKILQTVQTMQTVQTIFQPIFQQYEKLFDVFIQQANEAQEHYLQNGDVSGLDEAIYLWEQILQHPHFSKIDNNFQLAVINKSAVTYFRRYWVTEQLNDLNIAISRCEIALNTASFHSLNLPSIFNNLGIGLSERYKRLNNPMDLEMAIDAFQQAVETTPTNSSNLSSILKNLGSRLIDRYEQLHSLGDLEMAIDAFQQAIDKAMSTFPDLPLYLNELGVGLHNRYTRLRNLEDLQMAIDAFQQAIKIVLPNSPNLPMYLNNLGNVFCDLYTHSQNEEDLKQSQQIFKYLLQLEEKNLQIKNFPSSVVDWLSWAFERNSWEEMEKVYLFMQNANQLLAGEKLLSEHQEAFLEETHGAGAAIAYSYIQRNNLKLSVEALEQGAARLLTAVLMKINPQSFKNNITTIFQTAQHDPLIYIFFTEKGGYALIVFQNNIEAVALPDLNSKVLIEKMAKQENEAEFSGYLGAYFSWLGNSRDPVARQKWFETLEETTGWLYQVIWQPLMESLPKQQKNITLIPNGILNLLPLHLAWIQKGDQKHYVLDDFVINYVPNALSLETAKKHAFLKPNKLLAIDNPLGDLPSSNVEVLNIAKHFTEKKVLPQQQATLKSVKNEINKDYTILHFSCHGSANIEKPLETGLFMANKEMLTVQDFLNVELKARLVTLSACETGVIGAKLPEEIVGLPASLLQAGVAGVIASLWAVNDLSTALLMIKFYDNFMQHPDNIAISLQQTQHWLRDSTRKELQEWAQQKSLPSKFQDQLEISVENPSDKPYQSPYYWGAFYATGL